jgi:hypothetical protein
VKALDYMLPPAQQTHITESYVSTPPALFIIDEAGVVWTLGFNQVMGPRGEYAFNVLMNGKETGEFASRIERRGGKIRIFTLGGWKRFTGKSFI